MQSTRNARRTAFSAALAAAMASVSALPATAGHGYKQTNSPAAAQSGSDRADRVEGTGVAQWMVKPGPSSWATAGAAPTEIAGPAEATVFRAFWEPLSPLPGTSNIRVEELTWQPGAGSGAFAMKTSLVCELTAGELDLLVAGEACTVQAGDVWICPTDQIHVAVNNGTEPAVLRIVLAV